MSISGVNIRMRSAAALETPHCQFCPPVSDNVWPCHWQRLILYAISCNRNMQKVYVKKTPEISSIPLFQCCFSEYFLTTFGKVSISPPRTKPLSGHSAGSQRWKFSKIFCAKLSQAAMLNFILPIFLFTEALIDHHKKCTKTVKMSPQTCLNKQMTWKVQNKCVNLKSFALNIFPISARMGAVDSAEQCSSGSKMCGQPTCLYGHHCQSALTLS